MPPNLPSVATATADKPRSILRLPGSARGLAARTGGFGVRLLLALGLALVVVGVVQYVVLSRHTEQQFIESAASGYRADAATLEAAYQQAIGEGKSHRAALEAVLEDAEDIAHRPGIKKMEFIDARGRVLAARDPNDVGEVDPEDISVVRSGEGYTGPERDEDEDPSQFEFDTLVRLPSGVYEFEVDEDGAPLGQQLAKLRAIIVLLVLLGCVVALPTFYLVGGRRLGQLHRAALARARRDGLTDLGNHLAFQEELRHAVAHALRYREPLTLALLDLDDFKLANDRYGHGHGDRLLAELAGLLSAGRASDRAFRIGGDEFAMILSGTELAGAEVRLNAIRDAAPGRLAGLTLSCGLASLDADTLDADSLQEQADAAVYEAKRRGRNQVVAFAGLDDTVIVTPAKARAVHELLANGVPTVAFQPIWDLDGHRVLGYEALARPSHEQELAGPGEAFEVAERIGRAHELDARCREAVLSRAGELPDDALLFLNVSPQTLDHDLLAGNRLVRAVEAAGLRPERVVLELTERSSARVDHVVREARRLRDLGFKLALDDVGAGNAGLEMLRSLEVDFVKIDRDVVRNALVQRGARAVLLAIVAFAGEVGTYVIAEGIEDHAMLDLVRRSDGVGFAAAGRVHGAQGYLLGRPSPDSPADRTNDLPAVLGGELVA